MQMSSYSPSHKPSIGFPFSDSAADLSRARAGLAARGYLRVDSCLDEALAECTYTELKEDPRYARMEDDVAKDYGVLQCKEGRLSPGVDKCCDFLTSPSFLGWLSKLLGTEVRVTRNPSPFRMKFGDCIVAHDDCSDYPSNRFSAVLHFSKAWRRQFGGNTVIGPVKRIEAVLSEGDRGRRWVFSSKRSVIVPGFNSLILIALRSGMAHKVTRVRVNHLRLTIVATYGLASV